LKFKLDSIQNNPNHKYDANTIDFYSYRDFNVYQDASSINGDIETKEYTKSVEEIKISSDNVINAYDHQISINKIENNNLNTDVLTHKSSSIYDAKYLVDIKELNGKNSKDIYYSSASGIVSSGIVVLPKNQEMESTANLIKSSNSKSSERPQKGQHFYQLHQVKQQAQIQSQSPTMQQVNNATKNYTKNNFKIGTGGSSLCCGMLNLCFNAMSCFSSCCLRPCCSVAALLGGLIFIGFILSFAILMGIFGVLPIPKEITRNICNYSERNEIPLNNYENKSLPTVNIDRNNSFLSLNKTNKYLSSFDKNIVTSSTFNSTTNKKTSIINIKNKIRNKARIQNKFKNKISKFIALQYDILLMPNSINKNILTLFTSTSATPTKMTETIDMKINLNVKLYCNFSTNLIFFKTREFSNIDISFEKTSDIDLKKWNFDTSTKILEIETSRNCSLFNLYHLNIFINYKNFGKTDDLSMNTKQDFNE
jgi:hypothetical protein